jgi:hypothetical protein
MRQLACVLGVMIAATPVAHSALAQDVVAAADAPVAVDAPAASAPTDSGAVDAPAAPAPTDSGAALTAPVPTTTNVVPNIVDELISEQPTELIEDEAGRELSAPAVDSRRVERLLAGIEAQRFSLRDDRGGANMEMAVAVNLYVGGVMLSILSASLLVGAILEGVCFNGNVDECTDGPGFIAGMIPSTLGAVALLVGASFTERSANVRHHDVDAREEALDEVADRVRSRYRVASRPAVQTPAVSLALGPTGLALFGAF